MTSPLKRKAFADAVEAQKCERKRRAKELEQLDANDPKISESERQAIKSQQQEYGVWSQPVLDRIEQPHELLDRDDKDVLQDDLDALWLRRGDEGIDDVKRMIEVVLEIPEKAPYEYLPSPPMKTPGIQNYDVLLKAHKAKMKKMDDETMHTDMVYAEKCRIAVAMQRLYKELDQNISVVAENQSNKCRRLETQMEAMLAEIATLRNDNMNMRIEIAGFRADLKQLKAAK